MYEALHIAGVVILVCYVVIPLINWWCDRSAFLAPPEGFTKKSWRKHLKDNGLL
jgi:hypothetical protein